MKDILVIQPQGYVVDKSNRYYANISGSTVFTYYGGMGATYASGPLNLVINQGGSGQVAAWNGANITWGTPQPSTATAYSYGVQPATNVGPKYISAVGGVFYKDQVADKSKYIPTIIGKFSNK